MDEDVPLQYWPKTLLSPAISYFSAVVDTAATSRAGDRYTRTLEAWFPKCNPAIAKVALVVCGSRSATLLVTYGTSDNVPANVATFTNLFTVDMQAPATCPAKHGQPAMYPDVPYVL
jgi:hypothetical protein